MRVNKKDWYEVLESLHFEEKDNTIFGGKVIYDDKGIPQWTYNDDDQEYKISLFHFLQGALYMKLHLKNY